MVKQIKQAYNWTKGKVIAGWNWTKSKWKRFWRWALGIGAATALAATLTTAPSDVVLNGVKYPKNIDTNEERIEYLLRAKQLIIDEHNEYGKDYRENKIGHNEWRDYQEFDFDMKLKLVLAELSRLREITEFSIVSSSTGETINVKLNPNKVKELKKSKKWDNKIKVKDLIDYEIIN